MPPEWSIPRLGANVGTNPHALVLMGPAGCGKSTVGQLLSEKLGRRFVDADDYHPHTNIEKMRAGDALTDEDRVPWLTSLRKLIHSEEASENLVIACSALRHQYRSTLASGERLVAFFLLDVPSDVLTKRLKERSDHFFSPELLESQMHALEPPTSEYRLDGTLTPERICQRIAELLSR